ncbi:maleate isomerase [Cognatiyoonia sediminum]|uniref:Maleate isomerase n=1 Tax=Cognatiyoonia sediminum TaxID=1508389 RepID=A0A1M5MDK9_9RHOB|nr:Asp/Glu racemase [Cognatiyoonia sediminum]SHG74999.1 maleate isomerase [Cognatiyoonia sediminum]
MIQLPYTLDADDPRVLPIGLIVLQADETLEIEFKTTLSDLENPVYVTRIASAESVSNDTLSAMKGDIASAASLLPNARKYAAIGYGCTSASSIIGSDVVSDLVRSVCDVKHVTDPLRAACENAKFLGVNRFALLSPYVEEVNLPLRSAFTDYGISTDVFGSFSEPSEANVARISTKSIVEAASQLGQDESVDSVFLSCTNLRTLEAISEIQNRIQKPVFSSNFCLAWHLKALSSG